MNASALKAQARLALRACDVIAFPAAVLRLSDETGVPFISLTHELLDELPSEYRGWWMGDNSACPHSPAVIAEQAMRIVQLMRQ